MFNNKLNIIIYKIVLGIDLAGLFRISVTSIFKRLIILAQFKLKLKEVHHSFKNFSRRKKLVILLFIPFLCSKPSNTIFGHL